MSQAEIFKEFEGQNWYERNKDVLKCTEDDFIFRVISLYNLKPKTILEVGCSDGFRLDFLNQKLNADCSGFEANPKPVEVGLVKYPNIRLKQGLCKDIPFEEKFDLVICNFVLHWIDREDLISSINEIDRMVKPKGYLIIGDFFPNEPTVNDYTHISGGTVKTYKQDYSLCFTEGGGYTNLAHLTSSFSLGSSSPSLKGIVPVSDSNDRTHVCLLQKK